MPHQRLASHMPATRCLADLPGPGGLPLLGMTLQARPERLHQQFAQWTREHGSPCRVRLGLQDYFVSSDPQVNAQVMRERPETFSRPARLESIAREMGALGLFSVNGEDWRRQRPLVMAALDPAHVRAWVPAMARVVQRLLRRWRAHAARGVRFDLVAELTRYTMDVICGLAFGVDVNSIEAPEDSLQQHLRDLFRMTQKRLLAPLPYWHWIRFAEDRRFERDMRQVHAAIDGFIAQARAGLERQPELRRQPANLLQALVATRDESGSGFSDEDLHGNVLTMLLAGEDTTAQTLAWVLYLLHRHPQAADRARAEVDEVLAGAEIASELAQLERLEHIEACIAETMRLYPVGPLIALEARRDTVVAGVALPRGTGVMLETRAAGLDAAQFEQPEAFVPERWLPGQWSRHLASTRRAVMPFGAGARICPGRYLSLVEMKMLLAMLLRHFELEEVRGPGGAPVREHYAFSMRPAGLEAALRPRRGR